MDTDLSKYKFNHTMIRIKDPKESLKFYEFLGMKLINKLENPDAKFDLYFLAYDGPYAVSSGRHWTDREGILELTHNYGTENDPNFKIVNSNFDPYKGYSHVSVATDNVQAACQRLEDAGYKFHKTLRQEENWFAVVQDPDGYWVEINSPNPIAKTEGNKETDIGKYRLVNG